MPESQKEEIKTLIDKLHHKAAHPPRAELTYKNAQKWEEYTAGCREIERELVRLGVEV